MKVYDTEKMNEFEIIKYDWIFGILGMIPLVRLGRAIYANAFGVGSYFITLLISITFGVMEKIINKMFIDEEVMYELLGLIFIIEAIVQGFIFSWLRERNVFKDSNRFKILED